MAPIRLLRTPDAFNHPDWIVQPKIDGFRGLDLEGIVGKWNAGRYSTDPCITSWVKINNPAYSQMDGREELLKSRAPAIRSRTKARALVLAPPFTRATSRAQSRAS